MLIPRIMAALVDSLIQHDELVLVPGASRQAVVAELVGALGGQASFAQLGPFVSGVLVRSELVDELYVDDAGLLRRISDLEP